jgi:hypothetical protein
MKLRLGILAMWAWLLAILAMWALASCEGFKVAGEASGLGGRRARQGETPDR